MTHIQVHVVKKAAGSTAGSPTTSHEDVVKRRRRASDSDDSSEKEASQQSASDSDEDGKSNTKRATPPLSPSSSEEDTSRDKKQPRHRGSDSDSEDVKAKHPKTTGRRKVVEGTFVEAAHDVNAAGHNATKEHAKQATPEISPSSSEDDIGDEKKRTHQGSARDSDDAKAKHPKTSGRRKVVESTFVVAAHDANTDGHNSPHPEATSDVSALDADDVTKAGTAVAAAAAAAAVAMRLADQRSVDEPDVAQCVRQCSENPHVACIVVALGVLLVYCLLRK